MALREVGASPETQSLSVALACLFVVYMVLPRLSRGLPRLFFLLPMLPIWAWVPFSTRPHFPRSILSFMFLWVCPSKLLLRCWDIFADCPAHGFPYFLATSLMPLRVRATSQPTGGGSKSAPAHTIQGAVFLPFLHFLCFLATLNAIWYVEDASRWISHGLHCLLVYLGLEGILGLFSKLISLLLRVELQPFFDKPFLASSLSEFWGRRWNLLVSYLIRETVYAPILHALSCGRRQPQHGIKTPSSPSNTSIGSPQICMLRNPDVGNTLSTCRNAETNPRRSNGAMQENPRRSNGEIQEDAIVTSAVPEKEIRDAHTSPLTDRAVAMFLSFVASGLMHELLFYCITQRPPSWEVTWFFVLHGVASVLEVFLRRRFPNRRSLPRPIAIVCTLTFLFFSAAWLFMPPITRSGADLRILAELHQFQNVVVDLFSKQRRGEWVNGR